METNTYLVPTWALAALAYGDTDHLSQEDIELIEKFEERITQECGSDYIVDFRFDEDSQFYHDNDLSNQGANCIEMLVSYFPEEN